MILMKWKFWKHEEPVDYRVYGKHYEDNYVPENDGVAAIQNADEIEFNKNNPTLFSRSVIAKEKYEQRLDKDGKHKLLESIYLQEALDESFVFGDRDDMK